MGVDMMELGGNITLTGFRDRDYAELIVIKKIVGRYAREISDRHQGFEHLSVALEHRNGSHEIKASCTVKGAEAVSLMQDPNLFVALDSALKKLVQQL